MSRDSERASNFTSNPSLRSHIELFWPGGMRRTFCPETFGHGVIENIDASAVDYTALFYQRHPEKMFAHRNINQRQNILQVFIDVFCNKLIDLHRYLRRIMFDQRGETFFVMRCCSVLTVTIHQRVPIVFYVGV